VFFDLIIAQCESARRSRNGLCSHSVSLLHEPRVSTALAVSHTVKDQQPITAIATRIRFELKRHSRTQYENCSRATTIMSSPPRLRYKLPASLIFTNREMKQYRRWQSLHTTLKPTECGLLPTAIEYDEFQQWLKKQDSGYFSDVFDDIYEHIQPPTSPSEPTIASVCRHTMHPVAVGQPRLRCPVCTIDIHLNYMKVLTRSLHGVNGRPLPCTGTPSEQQENLYLAWSQGKMSTLREVCELEELSAKETEWSEKHLNAPHGDVQSATKALELYWFEVTECESAQQCDTSAKKKTIVFAEDTNFSPGRPTDYFLRRSPRYEPGKYTVPEEEREEDDDISEDSEDYSRARVFAMGGTAEVDNDDITVAPEDLVQSGDFTQELEDDDGDSDWEDIDSDEEGEESIDGSYVSSEVEEESSFVVFLDD